MVRFDRERGALVDISSLVHQIASVSHFRGLAETDLKTIVTSGQILRFSAGSTIFNEGETCAGLFVLLSGQVHLCKLGPRGQMSIMAVIKPVIMFNEVAALDGGINPATAAADQDSVAWQIGYERFQILMQRYPPIGLGLLRVLAARNRLLISHYEDLSFRTVLARTAKLLLDLSQQGHQPIKRSEHTNNKMAARVATVPEVISRSIKYFRLEGHITCSRSQIVVSQPERLLELAEVLPGLYK